MTEGGGWYPDPDGVPGRERWWDGTGWTERTREPADELAGYGAGRWPGSWFAGRRRLALLGAAGVLVLAVVGALVATRGGPPDRTAAAPGASSGSNPQAPTVPPERPRVSPAPLDCPTAAPTPPTAPPTTGPTTGPPGSTPPTRAPRVTDRQAGISYAGQGRPWAPWSNEWVTPGLGAQFGAGYYLVTQGDTPEGPYFATVLSGTVAARAPDAPPAEVRCVAERIADDVRAAYYPSPNLRQIVTAHPVTVGDHAGYLIRYHLSFHVEGYDARGEQVGVLVLDVGRPALAVLYISIPDTVRRFDPLLDEVFDSVRAI